MRNEHEIEAALVAGGKMARRLTPGDIDATIVTDTYWTPPGTSLTVCVLGLRNGFQVVGHSAAASIKNFDAEIGRQLARDAARQKIWVLEGYLLRDFLFNEEA